MATLTDGQLVAARRTYAQSGALVDLSKPQVNAAIQAIEDWFELAATKAAVASAINTALSPKATTAAQKRQLVRAWLLQKFDIEA